jgi:membrane protease YdiL (CAAX protease family)
VTVLEAELAGRTLRPPRWGLWDVLWAAIAAVAIGVGVGAGLFFLDAPLGIQVLIGAMVPWLALAGWPIAATIRRGNGPRIDLGLRLTWPDTGWGVLAGFVGLMSSAIAALISRFFVPDLSSAAADAAEELEQGAGRLSLTIFAVLIMVGAPVVEELFFRGFLFAALRKRGVSGLLTVVITAVVFAGFHFEPLRFFVLLPTGLVLGWVRLKTGSTGSAMVAHGLVNAPGAVLLLVGVPEMTP